MSVISKNDFEDKLEGKSWKSFFEYVDKNGPSSSSDESDTIFEKNFGALSPLSASSLCKSKSSSFTTLPYKKASCYGFCPIEETESLKIIKCMYCGLIVKVVGYGHHMRLRHGYKPSTPSSASSSGDDCQDFLLSPPHLPTRPIGTSLLSSPNIEVNEQSLQVSNDPSSSLSTSNVGTDFGSRICSPPYYVERCKDLVMIISKRTPLKNSNKKQLSPVDKEKSLSQDSNSNSCDSHNIVKHRKRKNRKKKEKKVGSLKSSQNDTSIINDSQSILSTSSKLDNKDLSVVDQLLSDEKNVTSKKDTSELLLALDSSKKIKSKNLNIKRNSKNELESEKNKKIFVKESDLNMPSSSTAIQVNCLENVSISKHSRRKTKNTQQKIVSKKEDEFILPKFCDDKSNLIELLPDNFASRVPDLHAQAKQCLSSDVFSNLEYRKNILMKLDSNNITDPKKFMFPNLLYKNKHVSFSLPLSSSPESGSSASSISDEKNVPIISSLTFDSTTTPSLKKIELHTKSPVMDLKTKEMRNFLLQSTKNKETDILMSEETLLKQNEMTQKILFKNYVKEDLVASNSKPNITPFFSLNQNDVLEKNLFCSKIDDSIINPTLRRSIKSKKKDISNDLPLVVNTESRLLTKNYNDPSIGRSIVEGTTKFISVNPNSFLNKKSVTSNTCCNPIVLSKSPKIDSSFINEKTEFSTALDESNTNQEFLHEAKNYAQTLSEKISMPNIGFLQNSQQSNDSLIEGLRHPLNNQNVNKLHSIKNLSFDQQQIFAETAEQRHQRIMMIRAAQVTGGCAGNEMEIDGVKNLSVGNSKDNTSLNLIYPNLAKKRNNAESDAKFNASTSGSIVGNQQLKVSPNQQTFIKKFRPIIPRQSLCAQNGLNYSNYGVVVNSNNGSALKNGNAETVLKNASGISKPINYFKNVPNISNFRSIAPQKKQISSLSHQNRYKNGLTQDSTNLSLVSNTINGDESHCNIMSKSKATSNHFLRLDSDMDNANTLNDLQYNNLKRPTLTVRRYISGSNTSSVFSVPQQSFPHLNQKQQPSVANNFSNNVRHRISPFSQTLLVNHNNNRNNEDAGNQFQNIEPPPILEAEGRVSSDNNFSMFDSISTNKNNLFQKNVHQQQSFLYDKKPKYLSQVSGSGLTSSRHVNVQLVYQSQQQEHPHHLLQSQRYGNKTSYLNNLATLQQQSPVVGQYIPQQQLYNLPKQQGYYQK